MTFDDLRDANVRRCEGSFKHKLSDWSVLEWAGAMAGECGEACNVAKKIHRGDQVSTRELADEIADMVIYADLLAARAGIDLHVAIVDKFNRTSRRRGSEVMLSC